MIAHHPLPPPLRGGQQFRPRGRCVSASTSRGGASKQPEAEDLTLACGRPEASEPYGRSQPGRRVASAPNYRTPNAATGLDFFCTPHRVPCQTIWRKRRNEASCFRQPQTRQFETGQPRIDRALPARGRGTGVWYTPGSEGEEDHVHHPRRRRLVLEEADQHGVQIGKLSRWQGQNNGGLGPEDSEVPGEVRTDLPRNEKAEREEAPSYRFLYRGASAPLLGGSADVVHLATSSCGSPVGGAWPMGLDLDP